MRWLILSLLLSGCTRYMPGHWNMIQCGELNGCDVEYTFRTKDECEGMAKQFGPSIFKYECVEVK